MPFGPFDYDGAIRFPKFNYNVKILSLQNLGRRHHAIKLRAKEICNFFEISPKRNDVRINIFYMFAQSNFKNSSPIVFDQLSHKHQKINEKKSP
jgi:hypothetical protein